MPKQRFYVITYAPFNIVKDAGIFEYKEQAVRWAKQANRIDPNYRGKGLKVEESDERGFPLKWKSEEEGRMKRNPKSRQPKPYAVIGGFEYWLGKDGEIYRNLKGNRGPIADTGLPNNVRWECSKEHFDRYRKLGVFGKEENPSLFGSSTSDMFEDFHGYPSTSHTEIEEEERYRSNLAELGGLEELEILEANGKSVIPISFGHDVIVACDKWGKQIYFEGGNQELDLDALIDAKLIDEHEAEKDLVTIGEVFSISYYAKKTHLKGPKKASNYIHQFGKDGGSLPTLLYDRLNKKMMLSGGSYKIKDVGIVN